MSIIVSESDHLSYWGLRNRGEDLLHREGSRTPSTWTRPQLWWSWDKADTLPPHVSHKPQHHNCMTAAWSSDDCLVSTPCYLLWSLPHLYILLSSLILIRLYSVLSFLLTDSPLHSLSSLIIPSSLQPATIPLLPAPATHIPNHCFCRKAYRPPGISPLVPPAVLKIQSKLVSL